MYRVEKKILGHKVNVKFVRTNPQTVLAVWGPGGAEGPVNCSGLLLVWRSRKIIQNNEPLGFFKKHGAGARVLRSTISFLMNG